MSVTIRNGNQRQTIQDADINAVADTVLARPQAFGLTGHAATNRTFTRQEIRQLLDRDGNGQITREDAEQFIAQIGNTNRDVINRLSFGFLKLAETYRGLLPSSQQATVAVDSSTRLDIHEERILDNPDRRRYERFCSIFHYFRGSLQSTESSHGPAAGPNLYNCPTPGQAGVVIFINRGSDYGQ